ncbi:hypothetical protein E3T61_16130 [Cryobacterium lactosi]|uniref:Uncharacterized protein n=1 Tax=Cryobacterium lactosi TaxID=1259202 RepID=A0A4R9BL22_9MICO|nr:hypothetical protein E3T61_16130 [Cryobacterium lactosi]
MARAPTPGRADYLSGLDRWGAPVSLTLSAAALVGLNVLVSVNPNGTFDDPVRAGLWFPSGLLWAVAFVSFLVGRMLTGRILQHGQPARDDTELAWSDALRSRTLRVFALTPAIGAFAGLAAALLTVSSAVSTESATGRVISLAATLTLAVISLALAGFSLWSEFTTRTPHYLVRLWPAVVAQLRDPDRQVVAASTWGP